MKITLNHGGLGHKVEHTVLTPGTINVERVDPIYVNQYVQQAFMISRDYDDIATYCKMTTKVEELVTVNMSKGTLDVIRRDMNLIDEIQRNPNTRRMWDEICTMVYLTRDWNI